MRFLPVGGVDGGVPVPVGGVDGGVFMEEPGLFRNEVLGGVVSFLVFKEVFDDGLVGLFFSLGIVSLRSFACSL